MSNYVDTFDSYSAGSGLPTGWTSRFDTGTWSIVDVSGNKVLRESSGSYNRYFASCDAVNSDSNRANSEVLIKFRLSSISTTGITYAGAMTRASGDGTAETAYAAVIVEATPFKVRINKYVSGTATMLGESALSFTIAANTWMWMRFRANGTSLQARVWQDGSSEPGTWDVSLTDSSISAAGWSGVFSFLNIDKDFSDFVVATNGDTATLSASISASYGTADAVGYTATVASSVTINATYGQATADGYAASVGSMAISGSYERSSVNVSSSSVSGSGDSAIITIWPRMVGSEVSSDVTAWLEPSAKVTGVNGYRPTFRFGSYLTSGAGKYWGQPWQSTRRPMYSYDGVTWTYFDTAVTVDTTNHWIEFRNSTAFTGNTVYISRGRQRSVTQVGDWIASLAGTYGFISPTTSGASFTPSTTTSFPAQAYICDEYSTQTDELGATVPATPFYGFVINDTSLMPTSGAQKKLAIVLGGVHAGEDHANYVLEKFVETVCGATAYGQNVRRNFKIFVYPMLNAPGRYGGHWRGSFQEGTGGADDLNRHFSDATPGLEIVTKPRTAIETDRASASIAWVIDFHGDYGVAGDPYGIYCSPDPTLARHRFKTAWEVYQGTIFDISSVYGDISSGATVEYFRSTDSVPYAMTLEFGDPTQVSDATITTIGQNLVKTVSDLQDVAAFGIDAVLGTATATGYTATVSSGSTITATYGQATATGYTATVSQVATIDALYSPATATGYTAAVTGTTQIFATYGGASASGFTADVSVVSKVGGDDVPEERVEIWEKYKARKNRDAALEAAVVESFRQISGIQEPVPAKAIASVKEEVRQAMPAKPEAFDYSSVQEWLQLQQMVVQQIIAQQIDEDDEDVLMLLAA